MQDAFDDGIRLFLRAVRGVTDEVRPGDSLQGGVALRTSADEILVHSYTFRQVCRNGAIMTHTLQTHRIDRVSFSASSEQIEQVLAEVREAVRACSSDEAFSAAVDQMRAAAEVSSDIALQTLQMLAQVQDISPEFVATIWERFESESDRSAFGLINAVTSTARDVSDPELRWRLEELGGGMPALLRSALTPGGTSTVRQIAEEISESKRVGRKRVAKVGV